MHVSDILAPEWAQVVIDKITDDMSIEPDQVSFHPVKTKGGLMYCFLVCNTDKSLIREYLIVNGANGDPYCLTHRTFEHGALIYQSVGVTYLFDGQLDDHDGFLNLIRAMKPVGF